MIWRPINIVLIKVVLVMGSFLLLAQLTGATELSPLGPKTALCKSLLQSRRPRSFVGMYSEVKKIYEGPTVGTLFNGDKVDVPNAPKFTAEHAWDKMALGIFAEIERPSSKVDKKLGATELDAHAVENLRNKLLAEPEFRRALDNRESLKLPAEIGKDLSVHDLFGDFVLFTVRSSSKEGDPRFPQLSTDLLAQAVNSGLSTMNMQLYNRAYRRTELVPNEALSSAKLLDGWVDSLYEDQLPITYLGFHRTVWESYVKLVNEN